MSLHFAAWGDHLREQEMSLHDIAKKLAISRFSRFVWHCDSSSQRSAADGRITLW